MTKPATHEETFEAGLAVRKKVLGDAHVERSLDNTTDFGRPIQELVTEYCWGTIWTREGLPLHSRSLINLAMLTALNRSHELGVHVRGALNNGVSREEIQEVFLQTAIYVGVPAALESFRIAESVFQELNVND
ncbi:Carboxymuconolactone decarboxylase family protein [Arthrobacter ulcerisalmonis]|jgi:4-carboxymuconolactone decarboxylase|uniref:Carboxymuconolactone decarboxylase family protein n=1 Tax=Arthrobacter ulcerisalmonis TaxID=2483813 RepID=A0A3P5WF86_9MICC|nr:4-carboxymuconolactone decarboxylase [Arthrobacter ulcerisalmonis]VDC18527.1 Carboxymuconolactone decarboxylase family protein [Arthrobacter ulcerisalmonis]